MDMDETKRENGYDYFHQGWGGCVGLNPYVTSVHLPLCLYPVA